MHYFLHFTTICKLPTSQTSFKGTYKWKSEGAISECVVGDWEPQISLLKGFFGMGSRMRVAIVMAPTSHKPYGIQECHAWLYGLNLDWYLVMLQCPFLLLFFHPASWLWPVPVCHCWLMHIFSLCIMCLFTFNLFRLDKIFLLSAPSYAFSISVEAVITSFTWECFSISWCWCFCWWWLTTVTRLGNFVLAKFSFWIHFVHSRFDHVKSRVHLLTQMIYVLSINVYKRHQWEYLKSLNWKTKILMVRSYYKGPSGNMMVSKKIKGNFNKIITQ